MYAFRFWKTSVPHANYVIHPAIATPGSVPDSLRRDQPEVGGQPDYDLGFSQEPPVLEHWLSLVSFAGLEIAV